jgi:hypothetical protein
MLQKLWPTLLFNDPVRKNSHNQERWVSIDYSLKEAVNTWTTSLWKNRMFVLTPAFYTWLLVRSSTEGASPTNVFFLSRGRPEWNPPTTSKRRFFREGELLRNWFPYSKAWSQRRSNWVGWPQKAIKPYQKQCSYPSSTQVSLSLPTIQYDHKLELLFPITTLLFNLSSQSRKNSLAGWESNYAFLLLKVVCFVRLDV